MSDVGKIVPLSDGSDILRDIALLDPLRIVSDDMVLWVAVKLTAVSGAGTMSIIPEVLGVSRDAVALREATRRDGAIVLPGRMVR